MLRISPILVLLLFFISCTQEEAAIPLPEKEELQFIAAADISKFPEISRVGPVFFDHDGNEADFLTILKASGINTIRLRLWVQPENEHSGLNEVRMFSRELRRQGFKIWLSLHYSDTWADPGHQQVPAQWDGLDFNTVKDSVYQYTRKVTTEIQPDYIQIGNEINSGILHPYGKLSINPKQFTELIAAGCAAVRDHSDGSKIILHFAGIRNASGFFEKFTLTDYDMIGLSFYPIWHGRSLEDLRETMQTLSHRYKKKVLIAETAYAFTLDWNDWTNNIVGSDQHLILPEYPASPLGQQQFIADLKQITRDIDNGIGLAYWGGELIAWKGDQNKYGSPWENQAFFDFENRALPVLKALGSE